MTTTLIEFVEKYSFNEIEKIIRENFSNFKLYEHCGGENSINTYFEFSYKDTVIFCYYTQNSIIYNFTTGKLKKKSLLNSDSPNDIKTEAFKIIAKHFSCRLWENDCRGNEFIDFNIEKIKHKKILSFTGFLEKHNNSPESLFYLYQKDKLNKLVDEYCAYKISLGV